MSTLWTPDGERPVRRDPPPAPAGGHGHEPGRDAGRDDDAGRDGDGGPDDARRPDDAMDDAMDDEELAELQAELAATPAVAIIANHCLGLFQLAALHLSNRPPNLAEARLAIDAMGAVVDGLRGRLGPDEGVLIDSLAQLRLAFVQIKGTEAADG